jgi:hypothetical protein
MREVTKQLAEYLVSFRENGRILSQNLINAASLGLVNENMIEDIGRRSGKVDDVLEAFHGCIKGTSTTWSAPHLENVIMMRKGNQADATVSQRP